MNTLNELISAARDSNERKGSCFILLDRSGSMSGTRWRNAIESINSYVAGFTENNVDVDITLVAFDSLNTVSGSNALTAGSYSTTMRFQILREKVSSLNWLNLAENEASPTGGTPLFDATARIIDMAEASKDDKVAIVIVTDGDENTSTEYKLAQITARIDECKKKNWEVLFLGNEFNPERLAVSMGLDATKFASVTQSVDMAATMTGLSVGTMNYYNTGTAVDMTSLKEKEVK